VIRPAAKFEQTASKNGLRINKKNLAAIVEHWNETDMLGMLQQLGVVPLSGQAGS